MTSTTLKEHVEALAERSTVPRSLLRNTSYLTIARLVAGLCSLTTIAFAGRGLGVELFGVLVLITSYTQSAIGLTSSSPGSSSCGMAVTD